MHLIKLNEFDFLTHVFLGVGVHTVSEAMENNKVNSLQSCKTETVALMVNLSTFLFYMYLFFNAESGSLNGTYSTHFCGDECCGPKKEENFNRNVAKAELAGAAKK